SRQYGLILKAKKDEVKKPPVVASVFGDDDDDEDKVDVSGTSRSVAAIRTMKQAERQHELAQAEDPLIFNYDANYEADERRKNEKIADQKKKDEVRASKYAEAIIKSHQRRELERVSREERQQQKERIQENGEFADKEVFVTGAYRKQMEEVAKLREEEAYEARFNAMTAVEKQKVWQAGMGRTLLNEIARDGETTKKEEKAEKKERNTRKRLDSDEEKEEAKEKKSEKKEVKKKSIYDSDPEDEKDAPPHKNFSGELKAGLNRVNKKTKSQTVKDRMFTPTPPSSDDEGKERRRRSPSPRRDDRERRRRDSSGDRRDHRERRKDSKDEKKERYEALGWPNWTVRYHHCRSPKREEKKEKTKDAAQLKKERFEKLKEIVKKRNGPQQIEEFRGRYLERKASGFVTLPL
ncbi:hypothetical protein PMAYCL1PPCAC_12217, partial [Pristionchus mayeri]